MTAKKRARPASRFPRPCSTCKAMPWRCPCRGNSRREAEEAEDERYTNEIYTKACKEAGVWANVGQYQTKGSTRRLTRAGLWVCPRCRSMNTVHKWSAKLRLVVSGARSCNNCGQTWGIGTAVSVITTTKVTGRSAIGPLVKPGTGGVLAGTSIAAIGSSATSGFVGSPGLSILLEPCYSNIQCPASDRAGTESLSWMLWHVQCIRCPVGGAVS